MKKDKSGKVETGEILTVQETAKYLRLHLMTTYKLLRDGAIPGKKIGGQWRCWRGDLESFVRSEEVLRKDSKAKKPGPRSYASCTKSGRLR